MIRKITRFNPSSISSLDFHARHASREVGSKLCDLAEQISQGQWSKSENIQKILADTFGQKFQVGQKEPDSFIDAARNAHRLEQSYLFVSSNVGLITRRLRLNLKFFRKSEPVSFMEVSVYFVAARTVHDGRIDTVLIGENCLTEVQVYTPKDDD